MQRSELIALLALVGLAAGHPIGIIAHAQQPTGAGQPNTASEPEPAVPPLPAEDQLQRIAAALEAANAESDPAAAHRHAQDDLKAQESMAASTFWMAILTVGSLLVSCAALIALYRSLSQTRTAINDNKIIGRAQVRAYLSIIRLRAPQEGPYALMYDIANHGSSPARGLISEHALWFPLPSGALHPLVQVPEGQQPDFLSDLGSEPEAVSFRDVMLGDAMLRQHIRGLPRMHPARLVARLRYRDVFDRYFECTYVSDFYRSGHDTASNELDYARVQSREIEIDKERYEKRDQVTIPDWASTVPKT